MSIRTETVLILGASGMLGNAVFQVLTQNGDHNVYGTCRSAGTVRHFHSNTQARIISGIDVENVDSLLGIFEKLNPTIIINCTGVVKQLSGANDPLCALPMNSILPHRLARLAAAARARLIHISTDCVFDGKRGNYREDDIPDATDLYGRSKLLGEVDYPNAITLRTSIIGHELASQNGLIDWFLNQKGSTLGFTKAVFSGLTTLELSHVISRHVIPNGDLRGIYHVSVDKISKYDLLNLVARIYKKKIEIIPRDTPEIDRSLSSERFRSDTGYNPPNWEFLISEMYKFHKIQIH